VTAEGANPAPPARGSRAGRIARALTLGYTYQAVVAVTGLVLTPFLLRELGLTDYGRWLVVGQVLGLLGLLDLGVTGVLPREVARASGTAGAEPVAEVVRRAWWLVWLQTPVVGLVASGAWYGVSEARPELSGPLALILGVFVVQFPLRVPAAVLNGLQDLTFGAAVQAAGWLVTTAVSVSLVFAGWGLYALAAGWSAGQLLSCLSCWVRLRRKFPQARGSAGWPGRTALKGYLRPSFWTSTRQVVQILLNGVDLILLGWLIGPAAVVLYACTVKLIQVVNAQPYMIAVAALPAISELAAGGDRERLWRAARAVGQGIVILSGGLVIVVIAVNAAFVKFWVGPEQYAGPLVTLLAVLVMVCRHWCFGLGQVMYALGAERLLAAASLADAAVTLTATVAWVSVVGVLGVPLGSMTGLFLTNVPAALVWLSRQVGGGPLIVLGWAAPWAVRFALVLAPAAAFSFTPWATDWRLAGGLLVAGLLVYGVAVYSLLRREPLAGYTRMVINRIRFVPGLARSPSGNDPAGNRTAGS
jgi:O-antigen/teichoic acid export membrane protein